MYFKDLSNYYEAKEQITDRFKKIIRVTNAPLSKACGLIVASDIFSLEALPYTDKSTVDGFAVRASDTYGASDSIPSLFRITGKIEMGKPALIEVHPGEAVEIPTGGMMPPGADSVVMVEHTSAIDQDLCVYNKVHVHQNVLCSGDDIQKGTMLLSRGDILTPSKIGLLAGLGIDNIPVYEKLKVSIISTGNELVDISAPAQNGFVRDINTYSLMGLCQKSLFSVVSTELIKDDLETLSKAISKTISQSDIVLVSGGSSVGTKDFTLLAMEKSGVSSFSNGLALKPGKPTLAGQKNDVLVFGLPGHPMAAALAYTMLVKRSFFEACGQTFAPKYFGKLNSNVHSSPGRVTCQPVSFCFSDTGFSVSPILGKSGLISTLAYADGFIILEENQEGLDAGAMVKIYEI